MGADQGCYLLTQPLQQITAAEVEACLEGDPRSDRPIVRHAPEFRTMTDLAIPAE